jgi:hypothetical protein
MPRSNGVVRTFLIAFALIAAWSASAVQAHAQVGESEYRFETDGGDVVLSNVTVSYVDAGYGNYVALLTVTPSQDEIDSLLLDDWSHVDIDFHFRGLEPSGRGVGFAPAVSDYLRQVGAVVEDGSSGPIYHAMGLNILNRWEADTSFTVLAPIFGYEPSGEGRPTVSVEMSSSKWWFADGDCAVAYERETNNELLQYCTVQDPESYATVFDEYGDSQFRLNN